MDECSKTKKIWSDLEWNIVREGSGIDIGCGPDPLLPHVRRFDVEDGDANRITEFVKEQFDFVFSSHCLEHMHQPREALLEWWKLVKPGGHIIFIIPDEDLYEQGIWPPRFNTDHKASFTLSKAQSWSPVSYNVLDLAQSLPGGKLVSLHLHDHCYDRGKMIHGTPPALPEGGKAWKAFKRIYCTLRNRLGIKDSFMEYVLQPPAKAPDQTLNPGTLAQIQCIVQKVG